MRRLLLVLPLLALALPAPAPAAFELEREVKTIDLPNGMRFLFVRRPGTGVFAGYVRVKVGGLDEEVGATGVAHLFEHMAFKGTSTIGTRDWPQEREILREVYELGEAISLERARGARADAARIAELDGKLRAAMERQRAFIEKDELTRILLQNGAANLNATTDKDLTSYFVSLPKNRLELWALLEAQRFAAPVLREYYSERDVVMEERRMRVETNPSGLLYEQVNATAFDASPYGWPTIGWMRDLERLTISDSMRLRAKTYVPSNAVGAIVGDLEEAEVREVLARTFGAIPAAPPPPAARSAEPPPRGERRRLVEFDAEPQLLAAFHKPTLPHRDDYVFDLLDILLTGGRSSRLHRRLVLEKRVATAVYTFGGPGSRLDNLFFVGAIPAAGKTNADVEKELFAALAELSTAEIPAADLEKARNRLEADFQRTLATNEGLASSLSYFEAVAGDWRYVAEHRKVIASLTADDVRRVAATYLVPANRTVAWLVKPAKAAAPAPAKKGGAK